MGKLLTGAEIFTECLEDLGVEIIFGYPGGAILAIYDKLFDYSTIRHILPRHEQAATHMAEGFSKATGKVGVVLVTTGPGVTNTVTGIADAFKDSVPMVVFAGQVPSTALGKDNFQEVDSVSIVKTITKKSVRVTRVEDFARTIYEAFSIAQSGRPGPVLVEMTSNILKEKCDFQQPTLVNQTAPIAQDDLISKAAEVISSSRRPVLVVGGGIISSDSEEEVREFALKNNIPVAMTLHGLGAMSSLSDLSLGMVGAFGTYQANNAVSNSDVLIGVGLRFDNRVTSSRPKFAPQAYKIHIDIDGTSFNKNIHTDLLIHSDAKHALRKLISEVIMPPRTEAWRERISNWKQDWDRDWINSLRIGDGKLRAVQFLDKLAKKTKSIDSTLVTDVGQFQMISAQHYPFNSPRSLITSGGLGTMGFSLPASIGVALSTPNTRVISVSGDGGFQMNMQELITAKIYNLPLIVIVLNNNTLGMVRQLQSLRFSEAYEATDLRNPDFVKLFQSCNYTTFHTDREDQVAGILDSAFKINDSPVGIVLDVVKEDFLFPLVPATDALHEPIVGTTERDEVQTIKSTIIESLMYHNMISSAEDIVSFESFDDGLINYVFGVRTKDKDLVIKHSKNKARGKPSVKINPKRLESEFDAINLFRRLSSQDHLPKTHYFDDKRMLLVMEMVSDTYSSLDADLKKGIVNVGVARTMGGALAKMHNDSHDKVNLSQSYDNIDMIKQLKMPFIYEGTTSDPDELKELSKLKSQLLINRSCLVHGDFKPNNIFVKGDDFKMIDFEQAHYGDNILDFVWLPAAYIVLSCLHPEKQEDYFVAVREYWKAYTDEIELPFDEELAMRHVGAIILARVDGVIKYDYLQPRRISSTLRASAKRLLLGNIKNIGGCLRDVKSGFEEVSAPTYSASDNSTP
jgi:acetolactate synthase I/II/III large subunit